MPLGFLHIPKTGGTALFAHMRDADERTVQTDPQFFHEVRDLLVDVARVGGHIPLFVFDTERTRRQIFTVLREPRARVVSFFNHIVSEPHHPAHAFFAAGPLAWGDAFRRRPFSLEACDLQTRMLGFQPEPTLLARARTGDTAAFAACLTAYAETPLTDADLVAALAAVRERLRVTVHEVLEFAVHSTFAELIGGRAAELPRMRVPRQRINPDAELLAAIDAHNSRDLTLYRAARDMALARAADDIGGIAELLGLDGAPFAFTGLHEEESYRGDMLRWTDGAAGLSILLPATTTICRVGVEAWMWPHVPLNHVFVTIDDAPATLLPDNATDRRRWELIVEPRERGGLREITVRVASDIRRFEGDPRALGIPLRSVRVSR